MQDKELANHSSSRPSLAPFAWCKTHQLIFKLALLPMRTRRPHPARRLHRHTTSRILDPPQTTLCPATRKSSSRKGTEISLAVAISRGKQGSVGPDGAKAEDVAHFVGDDVLEGSLGLHVGPVC